MMNSGKEGAMACTVAVEDTIVTHYTDQIREIIDQGKEEEYQDLLKVCWFMRQGGLDGGPGFRWNSPPPQSFYIMSNTSSNLMNVWFAIC